MRRGSSCQLVIYRSHPQVALECPKGLFHLGECHVELPDLFGAEIFAVGFNDIGAIDGLFGIDYHGLFSQDEIGYFAVVAKDNFDLIATRDAGVFCSQPSDSCRHGDRLGVLAALHRRLCAKSCANSIS